MFKTVRDIARIPDLRRRILYTLMMLALVRLGSLIPSPLMDAAVVKNYFASAGGVMALFDIMSGSAFSQMNLFATLAQNHIEIGSIYYGTEEVRPDTYSYQTEGIYKDAQGSEVQENDNSRLYRIAKSLVVHVRNADADMAMY